MNHDGIAALILLGISAALTIATIVWAIRAAS